MGRIFIRDRSLNLRIEMWYFKYKLLTLKLLNMKRRRIKKFNKLVISVNSQGEIIYRAPH